MFGAVQWQPSVDGQGHDEERHHQKGHRARCHHPAAAVRNVRTKYYPYPKKVPTKKPKPPS